MIDINRFHQSPLVPDNTLDPPENRVEHLKHTCKQTTIDGHILEFGVHTCKSANIIAQHFPDETVYGFDSFEGLPEDWKISFNEKFNKHKKGYFALDKLPKHESNVTLVKGWFDESIPKWLANNKIEQIKLLHIDGDLYSSAKTVLTMLNKYIVPGTIVLFDELYPWGRKRYERWAEHEWKALNEWVEEFSREFDVVSHNRHQQAAIRITK